MSNFLEIEGKTAVAIMLSGGVESTALIQHALDKDYYPMCFFLSMFPNTYCHMPHVKAICSLYGVEMWDLRLTGREFDQNQTHSRYTKHWWAVYGSMIVVGHTNLKYVWVGANSGIRFPNDIKDDPDPVALYGKSLSLIEQASAMVGGGATAYMPLWRLTKKQQWDMIPEEIHPHIVTCEYQEKFGQSRCGKCSKCVELRSIHEEDAYNEFCHVSH